MLRVIYSLARQMGDVHIAVAVTSADMDNSGYVLSTVDDGVDPLFRAIAVMTARWLGAEGIDKSVNATLLDAIWSTACDDLTDVS